VGTTNGRHQPANPIQHNNITVRWLSSLRTFLHSLNAEIELKQDQVPPLQHQRDKHVMDRILTTDAFTNKKFKQINNCRLFLQTITIADIGTAAYGAA
jgi:TPP-dependent 2-oxoacid decarboxylase